MERRYIITTEFRKTQKRLLEKKAFEWIEKIADAEDRPLSEVLRRLAVEAYKKEHKIK
ncbi:MAG: hypothetical protein WC622_16990 [Pedobacter sp.]|jgi:hypothetical protein|uniref:hypothetical protein n=1 Tax=Pedobacter sp. TaxID=1411316 RepID=UPI003564FC81